MRLEPVPASVTAARRWVRDTLEEWGCGAIIEPARVVVSELVGNVVRHAPGGSDVDLTLDVGEDVIRIAASDHDATPLRPRPVDLWGDAGRGLFLVDQLSDQWGVDYGPDGKTVWAEWLVSAPPARLRAAESTEA